MERKKTILQIIPSLISGGIERGVIEINDYLIENNFNSIVLSSGGKMVYQIEQAGGKHITLNVATKNPFKIWRNIKKIRNIIKENDVDLVHVRSRAPAWSAYYACKKAKCPLVSTIHGNYSTGSFPFSWLKKFYNSSMVRADKIICVSNYIKDYAFENYKIFRKKFAKGDATIIHRGVDIDVFNPKNVTQQRMVAIINKLQIPNDRSIILLPGRLTEWKGQMYFLDVLAKVKNQNYLCLIVGDSKDHNKYLKKLKIKIKKNHLSGLVRLENNIADMSAGYMIADIVVSSSIKGEAFGRVVPEAQAMKKMVIATSIGGSLETIIDGETGWLVDPQNTDKFAKTIDMVLSISLEEKTKRGERAREHIVDNYTTKKMCEKTINLYNEILNNEQKNDK
ncbi:MAG: glycosyltransferase family 4 protein [Rickettsiales bacterium]|nr:glycosyltransferase family 4 protein [Rickettsiales bacterium]